MHATTAGRIRYLFCVCMFLWGSHPLLVIRCYPLLVRYNSTSMSTQMSTQLGLVSTMRTFCRGYVCGTPFSLQRTHDLVMLVSPQANAPCAAHREWTVLSQ